MSDFSFTSAGVERPSNDFETMPAGEYPGMITKSEWMHPKPYGSQGVDYSAPQFLSVECQIIDGEFKNRKIWKKLHLKDVDATKVKRANGELASILDAIGKTSIQNLAELNNIPLTIKIGIFSPEPGKNINVINAFKAMKPATATAAPVSQKKPWE